MIKNNHLQKKRIHLKFNLNASRIFSTLSLKPVCYAAKKMALRGSIFMMLSHPWAHVAYGLGSYNDPIKLTGLEGPSGLSPVTVYLLFRSTTINLTGGGGVRYTYTYPSQGGVGGHHNGSIWFEYDAPGSHFIIYTDNTATVSNGVGFVCSADDPLVPTVLGLPNLGLNKLESYVGPQVLSVEDIAGIYFPNSIYGQGEIIFNYDRNFGRTLEYFEGSITLNYDNDAQSYASILPSGTTTINARAALEYTGADLSGTVNGDGTLTTTNAINAANKLGGSNLKWNINENVDAKASALPATTTINTGATLERTGEDTAATMITGDGSLTVASGTTMASELPATTTINSDATLERTGTDTAATMITGAGSLTVASGTTMASALPSGATTINSDATLSYSGPSLSGTVDGDGTLTTTSGLNAANTLGGSNLKWNIDGNVNAKASTLPATTTINSDGTLERTGEDTAATRITGAGSLTVASGTTMASALPSGATTINSDATLSYSGPSLSGTVDGNGTLTTTADNLDVANKLSAVANWVVGGTGAKADALPTIATTINAGKDLTYSGRTITGQFNNNGTLISTGILDAGNKISDGNWTIQSGSATASALPAGSVQLENSTVLTYTGSSTLTKAIAGGGTFKYQPTNPNLSIDNIDLPDATFEIGDGARDFTVTATNTLKKGTFTIEPKAKVLMTLTPEQTKDLILHGRGTFQLTGGGAVNARGSSPDIVITDGTFQVHNNYGAADGVKVTIHRNGVVNVLSGASLNAQSLTYYLGDGNSTDPSPDPISTGKLNLLAGANNSTLPPLIRVEKDTTLSDNDMITKLHTLAPGSTISTLITGVDKVNNGVYIPTLSEDITSGLFDFSLQQSGNNLDLMMQKNNTPEFLAILPAADIDAASFLAQGSVSGGVDQDIKPDPGAFHAKSLHIMQQVKSVFSSLKNKYIHMMSGSGKNAHTDSEPLVIPLKNSHAALFLAPIYGQSKTRTTELSTGSNAHQLGLLGGFETSNDDAQQFLSIQGGVLVGHSLVNKGSRSSTFSKTGILGVFFSQGFLKEAEWNTFANVSFTYAHANRFTSTEMYKSRPKSRTFNIASFLAYKFKFYDQGYEKSTLSFRPLVGLTYGHVESSGHTEKRTIGTGRGIETLADQYNLIDVMASLGVRRRFKLDDDISLKLTGITEYHQNIHRPSSMVKKVKFSEAAIPTAFAINQHTVHKFIGSLTGSISQKHNKWKAFLKASFIKTKNTTTQQIMLTVNKKF